MYNICYGIFFVVRYSYVVVISVVISERGDSENAKEAFFDSREFGIKQPHGFRSRLTRCFGTFCDLNINTEC